MELVRCTAPDHADNWWWGRALGSSRWAGGAECNKKQNTHTTNPTNWLEKTQQQKFTHAGWNKSATTGDMPNVHNEPLRMEHLDTLRSQRRLKCDGNKKESDARIRFWTECYDCEGPWLTCFSRLWIMVWKTWATSRAIPTIRRWAHTMPVA